METFGANGWGPRAGAFTGRVQRAWVKIASSTSRTAKPKPKTASPATDVTAMVQSAQGGKPCSRIRSHVQIAAIGAAGKTRAVSSTPAAESFGMVRRSRKHEAATRPAAPAAPAASPVRAKAARAARPIAPSSTSWGVPPRRSSCVRGTDHAVSIVESNARTATKTSAASNNALSKTIIKLHRCEGRTLPSREVETR